MQTEWLPHLLAATYRVTDNHTRGRHRSRSLLKYAIMCIILYLNLQSQHCEWLRYNRMIFFLYRIKRAAIMQLPFPFIFFPSLLYSLVRFCPFFICEHIFGSVFSLCNIYYVQLSVTVALHYSFLYGLRFDVCPITISDCITNLQEPFV